MTKGVKAKGEGRWSQMLNRRHFCLQHEKEKREKRQANVFLRKVKQGKGRKGSKSFCCAFYSHLFPHRLDIAFAISPQKSRPAIVLRHFTRRKVVVIIFKT